ncbi:Hypothetical protein FKW44_022715 [Caligus rogercresseyi]|uniref:Uncharacterized protein n=1 Tax=Caligus rogercresseyi TaxID=217165 RepID=A0A7T8GNT5_CALRO|nr:Hypothetical protein FKW44_022715 [Caligus rogercresseyi]
MGPWVLPTQSRCFGVKNPPPMGPHVLPNTIGVFWGYKSPANGPLGSAKPNRDVLGFTIHHQWTLRFRRTQSGCFGVTNPLPMGPWVPQNLIGVFWGYKSTANGPSDSAEHNQGVLGLQTHRQWALGFRRTHAWCFGVTNSPPMGPRVPPNLIGVFWGYISPANGPLGSAKPNRGVLGLQIPANGPRVPPNTIIIF